jgi:hypothetical protein
MTTALEEKYISFNILFFSAGNSGSPKNADPQNRVGDQDFGSPYRPISSGFQVTGQPRPYLAKTRQHW